MDVLGDDDRFCIVFLGGAVTLCFFTSYVVCSDCWKVPQSVRVIWSIGSFHLAIVERCARECDDSFVHPGLRVK
jgi:hypothetical protein